MEQEMGHEARKELEELLKKPRTLKEVKEYTVKINLGAGNVKRSTIKEIAEEYRTSEGGQAILRGNTLVLPIVDYVKKKFKVAPVDTPETLQEKLEYEYKELQRKFELTPLQAEDLIKGDKKAEVVAKVGKERVKKLQTLFEKYKSYENELAEIKVKTAFADLQEGGLIIRGLQKDSVWKRNEMLYTKAGFHISGQDKKDEYDLEVVVPDGDGISLVLVEVKNPNAYPWDTQAFPPGRGLFEGKKERNKPGSWGQLAKGYTFLSELFMDMKLGTVRAYTALPNMSREVVEKVMEPCCHQWVLCKEDLQPDTLRTKLGLSGISRTPRALQGLEQVCAMAARLVGLSSSQYLQLRDPSKVKAIEEKKLEEEVKEVEKDVWIHLSEEQTSAIEKSAEERKIICLEGAPGTGKTCVGLEMVRREVRRLEEETGEKPLVIFTTGQDIISDTNPLTHYLRASGKELGAEVKNWEELLEERGIARVKLRDTRFNTPEELVQFAQKMEEELGGKRVIILMDEASAHKAPREQGGRSWAAVQGVPAGVTVYLIFNPGFYSQPLQLPPCCLRLPLSASYRSTRAIAALHSCLIKAKKRHPPPSHPGTEVEGQVPRMVALGDLGQDAGTKLEAGLNMVKEWMGKTKDVTVITDHNNNLSDTTRAAVREKVEEWGWSVTDWGEMMGSEALHVVVVGHGHLEAISRARLTLALLHCYETEESKEWYNRRLPGYRAAVEEGRVVVATLPSYPQLAPPEARLATLPPSWPADRQAVVEAGYFLPGARHPQFTRLTCYHCGEEATEPPSLEEHIRWHHTTTNPPPPTTTCPGPAPPVAMSWLGLALPGPSWT